MRNVDMRDEDGQVVDGWIVRMRKAGYIFHADNSHFEALAHARARYNADGFRGGSGDLLSLHRHSFCGERHRVRRTTFFGGRAEAAA